ncbi:MAG: hypothetical protein M1538_03915 [Candidatus Marsarchaeota archaeon]|nr:hypothetical protein [Candidatus Marsarchaeota archaeon]
METSTQRKAGTVLGSRYGEFEPISGTTGVKIYVLNQEADHATSMDLLQKAGLRPYTYQEIILLLMKDEGLKNSLKGKWFYLAELGIGIDGLYTMDENGVLVNIRKKKIPVEEKIRVWPAKSLLSLVVNSDDVANDSWDDSWRFELADGRSCAAPMVIGTPIGREATDPKAAGSQAENWCRQERTETKEPLLDKKDASSL